jgi:hypothetical protein
MDMAGCVLAYNRPAHLRRVVESIAANPEAWDLPLVFFLDGGPGATVDENERVIRESALPRTHIVRHPRNLGCESNTIGAHRFLLEEMRCDVMLHLEDDLVLSPHYVGLMRRMVEWAASHYDNIAGVQGWERCLLTPEEKRERLRLVRPRCTSTHWWGYTLTRHAWARMRGVIDEYEERFLRDRADNTLDDAGIRQFIRDTVERGPGKPAGRLAPPEPNAEAGFLHPHTATGNDAIHALAMWKAGLVRLCTVVNRALPIGREGLHGTSDYFEAMELHRVTLDVFEEDRALSEFEMADQTPSAP